MRESLACLAVISRSRRVPRATLMRLERGAEVMRRALILAVLGCFAAGMARADCGDAVTNDRCDFGDRAAGRMPAESWGDFYARKQAEVEEQYRAPEADRRHKE